MARVVLRPLAPDLAFCRGSTVPFRPTAVGVASFTLPQLVHSSRGCLITLPQLILCRYLCCCFKGLSLVLSPASLDQRMLGSGLWGSDVETWSRSSVRGEERTGLLWKGSVGLSALG